MKILNAYAIVDPTTDLAVFKKIAADFADLSVTYEHVTENAISALNHKNFDLLIIDKAIPRADYNKLHKLADILHADAALVAFIMSDEDFIRYKLAGLMAKWTDAHSESQTRFFDNPEM
ncbi:hypothetical protein ABDK00_016555 [Niabella insulamsoli]|uniref:hypothetical protein n=1 Tax=Niabella insulamsoli TaxID=3144874 RepID=UPI0031FC138A